MGGGTPFGNYYYFFGSEILRREIELLSFSDQIDIPENALASLDLSERQNGSVMAWYVDEDSDGNYEVTFAQAGGVVANPNSSYLFAEIGWLSGMENLYTTGVEDMGGLEF